MQPANAKFIHPIIRRIKSRLAFAVIVLLVSIPAGSQEFSFTDQGVSNLPDIHNGEIKLVDVNADGMLDIFISGSDGSQAYLNVFVNNGDGTFTNFPMGFNGLYFTSADWGDHNNDGYPDLLISGVTYELEKVCKVYTNNGDNTFSDANAGLPQVALGAVAWADFNNDGRQDIFITGLINSSSRIARIYKNTGAGFVDTGTSLTAASNGNVICRDFTNNGYTDILINGQSTAGVKITNLIHNNGDFQFSQVTAGMVNGTNGGMDAGDYNNDGYPDVLVSGIDQNDNKFSKLYKNNNGIFVEVSSAGFFPLSNGFAGFADFNNNGLQDVIFNGIDSAGLYWTKLYVNKGDDTFTEDNTTIPGMVSGYAAPGDLNGDGDVDMVLSGKTDTGNRCIYYENQSATANIPPASSDGLTASAAHDSVVLAWNTSSDTETPAAAITYSVYAGTASGRENIVSPLSDIATGFKRTFTPGHRGARTTLTLHDLPEGNYYWGVQAVDIVYAGSDFSVEDSFTICHNVNIGNDTSVCTGETVRLTVGAPNDKVNWYSAKQGLLATDTGMYDFTAHETDSILAAGTKPFGCTVYDTIVISALSLPDVQIGNDTSICTGNSITLTAGDDWHTVNWSYANGNNIAVDEPEISVEVNEPLEIVAEVFNDLLCVNYDTIRIGIYELPTVAAGDDTVICQYDTLQKTATGNFESAQWYDVNDTILSTQASLKHIATQEEALVVKVTDTNGCMNSDSMTLSIYSLPVVELGADTSLCYDDTVTLHDPVERASRKWYSDVAGELANDDADVSFPVRQPHSVWVEVTDSNSCFGVDTIQVSQYDLPVFSLGDDTAACYNDELTLVAGTNWEQVVWRNDSALLHDNWYYTFQVKDTTRLYTTVTDQNNCSNSDTIVVNQYNLPVFSLGRDTSICLNDTLHLSSGTAWNTIDWMSALRGLFARNVDPVPVPGLEDETIWVELTDSNQCSFADTLGVTVHPLPEFTGLNDTSFCVNDTVHVSAPAEWHHATWHKLPDFSLISDSLSMTREVTGSYDVQVLAENAFGCRGIGTFHIEGRENPVFTAGEDAAACEGEPVLLETDTAWTKVSWYNTRGTEIYTEPGQFTYYPGEKDTLMARVFNELNCKTVDTVMVASLERPIADAGEDTLICHGQPVTLGGNPTAARGSGNYTYAWTSENGEISETLPNPVLTAQSDMVMSLYIEDSNACSAADTIRIQVNPPNLFDLDTVHNICFGNSLQLGGQPVVSGSIFPYQYHWSPSTGLDNPDIANPVADPLEDQKYMLVIETGHCGFDTAYTQVVVSPLPKIYATPEVTIGADEQVQLYAEGGDEYTWSPATGLNATDVSDPVATPLTSTTYNVEVTDSLGCINHKQVRVNVNNMVFIPELFTPNDDGENDRFKMYGYGFQTLRLQVFDRKNNLVFESTDTEAITETGWDGTFGGSPVETGTYRWVLEGRFSNGDPVLFEGRKQGIINLIR